MADPFDEIKKISKQFITPEQRQKLEQERPVEAEAKFAVAIQQIAPWMNELLREFMIACSMPAQDTHMLNAFETKGLSRTARVGNIFLEVVGDENGDVSAWNIGRLVQNGAQGNTKRKIDTVLPRVTSDFRIALAKSYKIAHGI